jgi:hypothetical protein
MVGTHHPSKRPSIRAWTSGLAHPVEMRSAWCDSMTAQAGIVHDHSARAAAVVAGDEFVRVRIDFP